MLKKRIKNKKGFTFVEVIVAVALLAVVGTLAFSMFSNSARYMSKAKKEEAKQTQAATMAAHDTFKYTEGDDAGRYVIYKRSTLVIEYMRLELNKTTINYYAELTYTTDYGNVNVRLPITFAPIEGGAQPGNAFAGGVPTANSYTRYKVLNTSPTRYIYIFDSPLTVANGALSADEEAKYAKTVKAA